MKIFLSYRREDSIVHVGRIYDRLEARFGQERIFRDLDNIPPGRDFRKVIEAEVAECDVLLAVIGDHWLTVTNEAGGRRLDNAADFVRLEIEAALRRDIPVIPVLVGKSGMPRADQLPAALQDLAYRNAVWVRPDPDFRNDIEKLIRGIDQTFAATVHRPSSTALLPQGRRLVLFLLDQSFSMEEPLGGGTGEKKEELAFAINNWLQKMVIRTTNDSRGSDWIDVAVIGYRTDQMGNPIIESAFNPPFSGRKEVSINEFIEHTPTAESWHSDTGASVAAWVAPFADGGTPTCHALHECYQIVSGWVERHPDGIPIVVNFTDGESMDGDPHPYVEAVRSLSTRQGNALVFHCHLSMIRTPPIVFPVSESSLSEKYSHVLFQMSSVVPDSLLQRTIAHGGLQIPPGARGMAYNADRKTLVEFLDVLTHAVIPC